MYLFIYLFIYLLIYSFIYLLSPQGDTVFDSVCLCVCLFVCQQLFSKKLWMDFDEIFWKCWGRTRTNWIDFEIIGRTQPLPTFKGKISLLIFWWLLITSSWKLYQRCIKGQGNHHYIFLLIRRCRPPPSISNGAPNQTITPDLVSMRVLLEIYLAIGKSPLQFENHSWSADLHQRSRV